MILISSFKMTKLTILMRMTTSSLMLRMMIICNYSLKKKSLKNLSPFTRQSQNLNLNKKEI